MDILFVNPNVNARIIYGKAFEKLGATQPPLGACYVASYLLKNNHEPGILDANLLLASDVDICERINDLKPRVVGFYMTTMACNIVKKVACEIKRRCHDVPIVIGGPHLQGVGRNVLEETCFDFGVVGEGEITTLEFLEELQGGHNYARVQGLIWKKENRNIMVNEARPFHDELDDFPVPARHLLPPLDKYRLKAMITKYHPAAHMLTSRGCPFHCVFCNNFFGNKVRFHSAEYVVDEMTELVSRYGMKEITLNDDTFLINPSRIFRICELIKERKLKVPWSCLMNVKTCTYELLKAIKDAGCWLIQPGIESGNPDILKLIRKPVDLDQALKVSAWARKIGLMVKPSFIIGHPGETAETIEDTIRFAIKMKSHYPSFALMTPFPGTQLWEMAEQYGTFDKTNFESLIPSRSVSFVPKGLTANFLKKKQKEAFRRVYLRPGMIMRHLLSIRGWEDCRKLFLALRALVLLD